jgi:nitric oxide dioxygenase
MALTFKQASLVRGTVPSLRAQGDHITGHFYDTMLRDHPNLASLFNVVNQANGRQPRALTNIILLFAENVHNMSEIAPRLERVCQRHCSLGIRPEHYDMLGRYLLRAFADVLGPAMTPEIRLAWTKAYNVLARMLIGREAHLYREFGSWDTWRPFRVDRKVSEADDMFSFYLVPQDQKPLPYFLPGQYVSVRLMIPSLGKVQTRQYSLSDAPSPDYYRITIRRDPGSHVQDGLSAARRLPGVVSNHMADNLRPGDIVDISHPAGEMCLDPDNTSSVPLVLISAGVGFTPLLSMFNVVVDRQPYRPVSWIHGSQRSAPFEEHIRRMQRARKPDLLHLNFFRTRLADSDLVGIQSRNDYNARVDLALIHEEDLYLNHGGTEYFICGPEQFMLEMAEFLEMKRVPMKRVHFELFSTGELSSEEIKQ